MNKLEFVKTWHCFFEQSNTFRDQFRKLGFKAFDYDIGHDAGTPDFSIDLFKEIDDFGLRKTVFSGLGFGDAIIAFFPCIRFSPQSMLLFQMTAQQYVDLPIEDKFLKSIKLHDELNRLFYLLNRLCFICCKKDIPLIIENPYRADFHYLTRYWFLKPKVIDMDRTMKGDYYQKPTQYFFVGCEPFDNVFFEPLPYHPSEKRIKDVHGIERSLIHPDYAKWFIRSFLLPPELASCGDAFVPQ